jgi:hypothetical protein
MGTEASTIGYRRVISRDEFSNRGGRQSECETRDLKRREREERVDVSQRKGGEQRETAREVGRRCKGGERR